MNSNTTTAVLRDYAQTTSDGLYLLTSADDLDASTVDAIDNLIAAAIRLAALGCENAVMDAELRKATDALVAQVEAVEDASTTDDFEEVADLVRGGWTVDNAYAHVDGSCDTLVCTHPVHWS